MFVLSQKSLEKLNGVHINLVNFFKELILISPWDFKITAGVRTAAEQNLEYQKGELKVFLADVVSPDISKNQNLEDRMLELENLVNTYG